MIVVVDIDIDVDVDVDVDVNVDVECLPVSALILCQASPFPAGGRSLSIL